MKRLKQGVGQRRGARGFTLIELLVVIAIIGILASLVLVALNNARLKARDARIKAGIQQLRILAEDANDTNGGASYIGPTVNAGTAAGDFETLRADIDTQNGPPANNVTRNATASAFCSSSPLNSGGSYCQDTDGTVAQSATAACTVGGTCSP